MIQSHTIKHTQEKHGKENELQNKIASTTGKTIDVKCYWRSKLNTNSLSEISTLKLLLLYS